MSRRIVFPNVNDRSPNEPSVLVSAPHVLAMFNQSQTHPVNKKDRVDDEVKNYYTDLAKANGWSNVSFIQNQCLLVAEFVK